MLAKTAPTDQRAGVRPISFVLDNAGDIGEPITLTLRPEDLRRTDQIRSTVHQTMGREVTGWVDSFGKGLPTVVISGHTGWRVADGNGLDGAQHFEALNQLVMHDFPAAQQDAVERGIDPGLVKLLFVDLLDGFAYPVMPGPFVLQRNKNRPLLFQYNISMQATATEIETPVAVAPNYGGATAGLTSLDAAIGDLDDLGADLPGALLSAFSLFDMQMSPLADLFGRLVSLSTWLFRAAIDEIRAAPSPTLGLSGPVVAQSAQVARAAVNVYRSVSAIALIPAHVRAPIVMTAATYNEIVCIFANSLRPRVTYENYDPLFGASGCSSTTGGRQRSAYADRNAFAVMQAGEALRTDSAAASSIQALANMDAILSPMDYQEIGRHIAAILEGVGP